jgi:hypothetical protein
MFITKLTEVATLVERLTMHPNPTAEKYDRNTT